MQILSARVSAVCVRVFACFVVVVCVCVCVCVNVLDVWQCLGCK
jgi:hypothetical protein